MATLTEILQIAGNLETAESMARELSARDPQFLLDLSLVLSARGKNEESNQIVDRLAEHHPDDNRIAFNRGWYILRSGDLQGGIEMLDRGRFEKVFGSLPIPGPMWQSVLSPSASGGFPLPLARGGARGEDKIVLLRGEGGLGDEMINVRFAKDIAKTGAKVLVSCNQSVQSLFARVDGVWKTVATKDLKQNMYDAWMPAMSAARICGHTYKTLPNKKYIDPLPTMVEKWKKIISPEKSSENKELKIGIRWSGNPQFEHEQFRRFPPDLLFNLAKIPGVKLFSLQRDHDLRAMPAEIEDLSTRLETWEDTAGAIENLDLIITSCTSIAHLAGAMGKETWVVVPIMPYYIWAMPGDKSPWYESVKVFRQSNENGWREPFLEIENALLAKLGHNTIIRPANQTVNQMNHSPKTGSKKTLHFMAGLPRAGSTMLISLLAQNPDIFGVPVSGLCGIVNGVNVNWDKIEFHKEVTNDGAKISTIKAVLENYHAGNDRPIIIDKERHWIRHITLLEKVLGRKVKIIIPVRPLAEILTSFEVLRQKNPLTLTMVDEFLAERSTLATRCDYFMNDTGPVGTCYNYMRDAVISGFLDRLLFVDYNKFVMNPERDIKRIYDFLELPYFKHDLNKIPQLVKSDDTVWRYPGLHDVRPELRRISADPMSILGPELTAKYTRVEPWEQWT